MKKLLLTAAVLGFTGWAGTVMAQDEKVKEKDKDKKKESQEVIIRTKTDVDTKVTVEIKGDKITINGKPMSEFKDDNVTINKRNVTVWDSRNKRAYEVAADDLMKGYNTWNDGESRAFLGVTTEEVDGGARINEITKESAAEKAGLKNGDVITKINDKKVDGPESLLDVITDMKPKDEVTVYYKRGGKENQSKAILGERKEPGSMSYSFSSPDGFARSYTIPRVPATPRVRTWNDGELGELKSLENLGNNFEFYNGFGRQQRLGLKIQDTEDGNGVKVLDVEKDSPADKAGLKKDDILTEVGGKNVKNTDEAREFLHDNAEKTSYNIKAKRSGSEMSFDIKIAKKLKTANL
jgi:serine protease Do